MLVLENGDDVLVKPMHSELVQIHWRPEEDMKSGKHLFPTKGADQTVIESQMKSLDQLFPHLMIKEDYGYQTHSLADGRPCEYNPYKAVMQRS